MIYFYFFFVLLTSSLSILFSKKSFYIPSLFIFISLVIFTTSRSGTGTDFHEYSLVWSKFAYSHSIYELSYYFNNIEVGYKFLAYVSGFFSKEFYWFLFVNAMLSLGLSLVGIYRLRKIIKINFIFAIFIYFCSFLIAYNFNAMRQAIAMGLFLLSIKDIIKDNKTNIILISTIALTLHSSGMFIIVSYIASKIRYDYYKLSFLVVGFGILAKVSHLSNMVFALIGFEKYNYFSAAWGSAGYLAIMLRVTLFLFMAFYLRHRERSSPMVLIFLLYSIGLMFYFLLLDAGLLASRVNMFFRVLEIIILPSIVISSYKNNRVITFFIIAVSCFIQLYMASLNPDNVYIFNKKIL